MSEYYDKFVKDYPQYKKEPLIKKSFEVAEEAHEGQLRNSGEPYITHPYEVSRILAELSLDSASICAAMLHDVPEDTDYTLEQVEKEFSPEIAKMVDGVTKLKKFEFQSKEEAQAENMRKMFIAMAADIRVIIIKLADRLHNMRTLQYKSEAKQKEKARETLEIYAPLAHRLGISKIKWEFEDLCLKYLEPQVYHDVAAMLSQTRASREKYIEDIIAQIRAKIDEMGMHAEIEGRPKHIYSIYKKMKNKGKTFDELYDLFAVRVIVETDKDCYAVLGAVHTMWRPLPQRFKDYIAVPKRNMYQSLHTTLVGEDGKPFEVQIRTFDMHRTAEYGIAAHWKYKDGTTKITDFDAKLTWLREMMEWQNDMKDSREFMEALKVDLFSANVLVYSPKGDVKDLVKGSTPLDFAYSVHTEVGNKCVGAKVNGKLVPLNYELQTADIIEIMTSASSKGPSRDWLNMVKTATARNKIRNWFKKEGREENVRKGREMLEREARRRGYDLYELTKPEWQKPIYKRYTAQTLDDIYAMVGYGGLTTSQVLVRLIDQYREENKLERLTVERGSGRGGHSKPEDAIIVRGMEDFAVRLAKCCNPAQGDDIVGFITRGRGVSVHRVDCSNLNDKDFPPEQRIEVAWRPKPSGDIKFEVEIKIEGADRNGLFIEVSQLLLSMGYGMTNINAHTMRNNRYVMNVKIRIASTEDLKKVLSRLEQVHGVDRAYRVNN